MGRITSGDEFGPTELDASALSTLSNSEHVVYGWDIEIVLLLKLTSPVRNNILGLWPIRQLYEANNEF
jgi:hypothetical protein